MPEQNTPVRPVQVHYICDTCQQGKMLPTGTAYLTSPPQYPHQCDHCGASNTFRVRYPVIRYEPITDSL